jgi:hypothetical protein
MAKSTIGLDFYTAEKMSLERLKNEVCEADAETCRMCECFSACAIGRRYVQEVSAGRILEGGNAPPPVPLIERQARALAERMAIVAAGFAAGKDEAAVCKLQLPDRLRRRRVRHRRPHPSPRPPIRR